MDISIDQEFQQQLPESWLCEVLSAALNIALPDGETCEVSLVVTGDETVRELNRDYRGLDEVTDVLSFSPLHSGTWEGETPQNREGLDGLTEPDFIYPPGEKAPLGDVIISFPQAQRQAMKSSQPLDLEMALLIVHGVLHLVGHDHTEPAEETDMQAKERAALNMIPRLDIPQSANQSPITQFSISHSTQGKQPRTVRK